MVGAASDRVPAWAGPGPELDFAVLSAESARHAAAPTMVFTLEIRAPGFEIRSILLDVQIQIAARKRPYGEGAQDRLLELFGTPERWGTTLRTLPWLRTTLVVPQFDDSTVLELPVQCTYDTEVTASRYFAALDDGEVPLEFLFSGSVFFSSPEGALQTVRIAWDRDVDFRLPVDVWRQTMERHFPQTAWLRLARDSYERLCAYKARHAHPSWEAAIDALLGEGEPR
jgi:hypothetical protein